MPTFERVLSGTPGLDCLVDNIRMGDNVVWQLDTLDQYRHFVIPYVTQAVRDGRRLNYVRFAGHPAILTPHQGMSVHEFDADKGFEAFTLQVHTLIASEGRDAFYVFDSLSELQAAWASDLMMGCFFRVTCPYLFDMNTVAFFAILRNMHSFDALARIRDTTQLLLDVYEDRGAHYVQPLKVWNRYSPTMFSPHRLSDDGQTALPLSDAVEAARFHAIISARGLSPVDSYLDHWDRTFLEAGRKLATHGEEPATVHSLVCMLMGREPRIARLAQEYFTVADLLDIKNRMIGSGEVGGKTAGMLLARKILEKRAPELYPGTEPHDSFYIGADVFYAFLVENGWWQLRLQQRTDSGYFSAAQELAGYIADGKFSTAIRDQFRRMLDHFGQSPIIVRSSSLLEDGFGNAFAGKYDSVFLVNAGTPEERLDAFELAVKQVYASAMNPSALAYRRLRHLASHDEQMAVLVQRVSGSDFGRYHMPCVAGVGHSHNAYVWDDEIDPAAGMLRLVAGLGTRAVDRIESDYPRLVSINAPQRMPVSGEMERIRYSQRFLDLIDLEAQEMATVELEDAVGRFPVWLRNLLCNRDYAAEAFYAGRGQDVRRYYCTCDGVVNNARFMDHMARMLSVLQKAYDYPVDIEFTANFSEEGAFVVNLLQCRPLQLRGEGGSVTIPEYDPSTLYFALSGSTMGGSVDWRIDYIILVAPEEYDPLSLSDKYETARTIGRLNQILGGDDVKILLIGPGRWGTRSPDLGVPVNFAEISAVSALCEVGGKTSPELSYGSHFFQDLVEAGIFYSALFPEREECRYRPEFIHKYRDIYPDLMAERGLPPAPLRVFRVTGEAVFLKSDVVSGTTVCGVFRER